MSSKVEMQCPNCKDSAVMKKYRGLVPNEGITFFESAYYFCPECGQIIRFGMTDPKEWNWMKPAYARGKELSYDITKPREYDDWEEGTYGC